MKDTNLLRLLFEAHRDDNDELFVQTAQSIIGRELASNHHAVAQQLARSLGIGEGNALQRHKLSALPTRNNGTSDALFVATIPAQTAKPVLAPAVLSRVERILAEHENRQRLLSHGLRPSTRILLWGPPGNGKTLTARYLAQELRIPIGLANLSSVISSLLGSTAAHLQQLFKAASDRPMVLFLDEFDALGKERNDELEIGEPKRIVNSLLQSIDAFESTQSILVAATNHQHLLDSAVWRRFDSVIEFPPPAQRERQVHLRQVLSGVKISGSLARAATAADGLSYADMSLATQECLKTMVLGDKKSLSESDLSHAFRERKRGIVNARKIIPAAR
jgi:SpoVK/Ycf46/Vps4 family AAA+-type ATPase